MVDKEAVPSKALKAYAEAEITRGLMAKYNSMVRQHEGLVVQLVDAEGDGKKKAVIMGQLKENLVRRKRYGLAAIARGGKLDDPVLKEKSK